jgi:hypothetical protein
MTKQMTPTCKAFLANQRKQQAIEDILDAVPWMEREDMTPTQWDEAIKTYWQEMEQLDDYEDQRETYQNALDVGVQ